MADGNSVLHPAFIDFTFTPRVVTRRPSSSTGTRLAGKTLITCAFGPLTDEEGTFSGVVTFWVSPPR